MRAFSLVAVLASACNLGVLTQRAAVEIQIGATCTMDTDCGSGELCVDKQCVQPTPTIVTVSVDPMTVVLADGMSTATVRVVLKDRTGKLSTHVSVELLLSGDGNTITPATAVTDDSGVALFHVASTKAEKKSIIVGAGEGGEQVTLMTDTTITFGPGAPAAISSLAIEPPVLAANDNNTATVSFVCRDAFGNTCAAGVVVALTSSDPFDVISPSQGTTNADGVVSATIKSRRSGAHTLTVTLGTLMLTQAPVTFTSGPPATLVFTAVPVGDLATMETLGNVEVSLVDGFGNLSLADGVAVTIAGDGTGTLLGTKTVMTSAGKASFSTLMCDRASHTHTLTASAAGFVSVQSDPFSVSAWKNITPFFATPKVIEKARGSSRVYVAGNGGLFRSDDGGNTYVRGGEGIPVAADICTLAALPQNPDVVIAGTSSGYGTFRSTDGGAHFTQIAGVTSCGIIATSAMDVFARGSGVIWASHDGGVTFSAMSTPITQDVLSFAFFSSQIGYASTKDKLYKMSDGLTFALVGALATGLYGMAVHPTDATVIYGADFNGNVSRGTSSGTSWTAMTGAAATKNGARLRTTPTSVWIGGTHVAHAAHDATVFTATADHLTPLANVTDLADIADDESEIIALAGITLSSVNQGASWQTRGPVFIGGDPLSLSVRHTASLFDFYLVTKSGLYYAAGAQAFAPLVANLSLSKRRGTSFFNDIFCFESGMPLSLSFFAAAPSAWAASTASFDGLAVGGSNMIGVGAGGVYNYNFASGWLTFAGAPTGGTQIAGKATALTPILVATSAGIQRSTNAYDASPVWSQVQALTGVNTLLFVSDIAFAAAGSQGVWRSTTDGATFVAKSVGLESKTVTHLAAAPSNANVLFAATAAQGVYRTGDNAESWSAVNMGIENANVAAVAVDPLDADTVYALILGSGATRGVYVTKSGGR